MIRSIIIEDEKMGRETLINYLLSECTDIEIEGEAVSVKEGIELINSLYPDLVFMDINLPDGTAFDIIEKVKNIEFELIFVTAYDNFALEAIKKSNCTDYIVKPISIEELKLAVEKVKANLQNKNEISILQKLEKQTNKITIPTLEKFEIIEIGDILYCEADRAWTTIYLENKTKITCSKNLASFEKILKNYNFFRPHRTYLINLSHLKSYVRGRGGIAVMSDGREIPIADANRITFLNNLQIIR